jgi:hypothetical protein
MTVEVGEKSFSSCESVKEREIIHCGGGGGWL